MSKSSLLIYGLTLLLAMLGGSAVPAAGQQLAAVAVSAANSLSYGLVTDTRFDEGGGNTAGALATAAQWGSTSFPISVYTTGEIFFTNTLTAYPNFMITVENQSLPSYLYLYQTTDGVTFTTPSGCTEPVWEFPGLGGTGTSAMTKASSIYYDGSTYWLVYEVNDDSTGQNAFGIAKATSPCGPWNWVADIPVFTSATGQMVYNPRWFTDASGNPYLIVGAGQCNSTPGGSCTSYADTYIGPAILTPHNVGTYTSWTSPSALYNGTYTSGGTLSGTGACTLTFTGGSSNATATVPVTSGAIAGGAALTVTNVGAGFSSAPASGTFGTCTGSASASGTATVSTNLSVPLVTGTGFPQRVIDEVVINPSASPNGLWTIFYKNQVTSNLEMMTSSSMASGYSVVKSGNWSGLGYFVEGYTLINTGSTGTANWRLYAVDQAGSLYKYVDSRDGWNSWWASSPSSMALTWNGSNAGTSGHYSAGIVGPYAGAFDGSTNYASIGQSYSFQPFDFSSSFSACTWSRFSSLTNGAAIAGIWLSGTYEWLMGVNTSGKLFTGIGNNNAYQGEVVSSATLTTGAWYHLCGVYDGAHLRQYINGVADANTTAESNVLGWNNAGVGFTVGKNADTASNCQTTPSCVAYTNGLLDDVRIYNRSLSAAEVGRLYQMQK